ncbi:MAG TPA: tetratricopeptide repeat protein, partial [Anaerovoracaceae bacterium]|nr:tetratricopeptide repeat protein [Anaerovoracaceae bacterium]
FCDALNPEFSEAEKTNRINSLNNLKDNISNYFKKKNLLKKVKSYTASWNKTSARVCDLETWGGWVYEDILEECKNHANDTWDSVPKNWQEQENALLNAFIEQHTHITISNTGTGKEEVPTFCGRNDLLIELRKHLLDDSSDNFGIVLTGESGSGKSAVFSMVNKMMQERKDCYILAHSAGLSPRTKRVADLLKIWNMQLAKFAGMNEPMVEESQTDDEPTFYFRDQANLPEASPIEKLQEKFRELLQIVSEKKRVLLLIDALDRFEPTARAQHMSWLPTVMPKNVRLICTAVTGTEQKATQYHKGLIPKNIDKFSKTEAEEMLNALCKKNHKTLSETVKRIILDKKRGDEQLAVSSPLWLGLAANIIMAIDQDDFEKISHVEGRGGEQIDTYIAHLVSEFSPQPGPLFISLTQKAGTVFGDTFTKVVFDNIAISRSGLREKDLEKLLHDKNWDSLQFANLRRWFKAHLVLQGEEMQWNLVHSILRNSLRENLTKVKSTTIHLEIANHLLTLPGTDFLRTSETMYHLLESEMLIEAANYYGSNLTDEEKSGATAVLVEAISGSENGLKKAIKLPNLLLDKFELLHTILKNYIYDLNDELAVEGNYEKRLSLLADLFMILKDYVKSKVFKGDFVNNYITISEKLGEIHKSLGQMEDALKYLEFTNQNLKVMFDMNQQSEMVKISLAISYDKLGDIHLEFGQLEKAIEDFENGNKLCKELFEANRQSIYIKNTLALSYGKLGDVHQTLSHTTEATDNFIKFNQLSKEIYDYNQHNETHKYDYAVSVCKLGDIQSTIGSN